MSIKGSLGRILEGIALRSSRSPVKVILGITLLTALAGVAASGLTMDPSIRALIPEQRPLVKEYVDTEFDFMHTEFIIAVIELPKKLPLTRYRKFLRRYKERLGEIEELDLERLNLDGHMTRKIKTYLQLHGLLLMTPDSLAELDEKLSEPVMESNLTQGNPKHRHLWSKIFDPLDLLPLIRTLLPLANRVTLDRSREFFITKNSRVLFFVIGSDLPWEWDRTQRIMAKAKQLEQETWDEVMPEIKRIHSGQHIPYPAITWVGKHMDVLRMTDVIWDAFLGTLVYSLILIALVFTLFFRSPRSLLLAFIPVIVGLIWSFALARLTVGSLNMLSILCGPLLIGLGIDFPIYLLNQFYRKRSEGHSVEEALRLTWRQTGRPVTLGALTTIAAFAALFASRLPAFRDVGYISSMGILLTLIAVLILLPAMIQLMERRAKVRQAQLYPKALIKIPLHRPGWTLLVCLLILGGLSALIINFRFQSPFKEAYYMLRQPAELSSATDRRFSELMDASLKPIRLVLEGDSWEEALEKNEELVGVLEKYRVNGQIAFYDSLSYWLPSGPRQEEATALLRQLKNIDPEAFAMRYAEFTQEVLKNRKLRRRDRAAYKLYEEEMEGFLRGKDPVDAQLMKEEGLGTILDRYLKEKDGRYLLKTYVYLPRGDYPSLKKKLMDQLLQEPLFKSGEVRYPSEEGIMDEIRILLEGDLLILGSVVLITILAIFLFAFRSLKITALSLVPMLAGGFAAVGAYTGIMGAFTVFNILWVPIYIGLATDDALHIGTILKREKNSLSEALRQSGSMIVLSSLTTMIAFGTSLLSEIQMLQRISIWIIIAMGCELLASLFFLPALLKLTNKKIH